MEIKYNYKRYVKFYNIINGEVFEHENELYIKTKEIITTDNDDNINAISLKTGEATYFYIDELVNPINGTFIVHSYNNFVNENCEG